MMRRVLPLLAGLLAVCAAYLLLCTLLNLNLMEHSPYDSYTLQAMTWRSGRISLESEYPWLEIAQFEGKRYISFPPFPTIPMFILTFFFGENTPSRLVAFALVIATYFIGYSTARRHGAKPCYSAFAAVFLIIGCNAAEFSLYGGVWNIAQTMGFTLTALAFYLSSRDQRGADYLSLIAIACAVGCRPFQALYVPVLLLLIGQRVYAAAPNRRSFFFTMFKLVFVPALIAAAYGAYNYARFRHPIEFGHNYLPEFLEQSEHGQFSIAYMRDNFINILRMPWFEDGHLAFPLAHGFAFYLVNPIFLLYALTFAMSAIRKKLSALDAFLLPALIVHFLLLLMHKSMGGVQFGTRYLCDLVPAMFFFITLRRGDTRAEKAVTAFLMLFGIILNVYGAWAFHAVWGM